MSFNNFFHVINASLSHNCSEAGGGDDHVSLLIKMLQLCSSFVEFKLSGKLTWKLCIQLQTRGFSGFFLICSPLGLDLDPARI